MLVASSYQRFYDALTSRERGRGQFLQACQAEAVQEHFGCREAQSAVGSGEFLHEVEIPKFYNEATLVGIEEPVDVRLAG